MVSKKLIINLPDGIQIASAGELADIAEKYPCKSQIIAGPHTINMRSLLNIVAISLKKGQEIEIICDGTGEASALQEAVSVIERG